MSRQRSRDTVPELELRRALFARGLRFFVHRRPLPEFRRTADVVFPRRRVAVFVDGCFWHGCEVHGNTPTPNAWYWPEKIARNKARDQDTDCRLREAGWLSIRVWEHESPAGAAAIIEQAVRNR
jgi:DNA mismatch endonuclease (patch repair protein)